MAKVFQLIAPSGTINLLDSSNFEVRDLPPQTLQEFSGIEGVPMQIIVKLNTQSNHDAAATDFQNLVKALKDVQDFQDTTWQDTHVYLKQQTSGETNARFAEVKRVLELEHPRLLDHVFDTHKKIIDVPFTLVREHPWRSAAPGTLGNAISLTETQGPTSPTMVEVANFRDTVSLTHVFHYDDSATTFSSNLISANANTGLFPSTPAANDIHYVGSTDDAWKHAVYGIQTAGSYNWDTKLQYWNGSAWTDMTLGTDYTVFRANGGEVTDDDSFFKNDGLWMINVFPPSDWAKTTINSQNAFWVRILIVTATSTTTVPTKDAETIYAQEDNFVEIPAASLVGDSSPTINVRMWAPSGGGTNEGPGNLSRVLIGAKSNVPANFIPTLNAGGNDNPNWSTAQGTDATSTADPQAPGGAHSLVDFSTDTTLVNRVKFTGTNLLDDYKGEYLVILRLQQLGGSAGDLEVQVRASIGGTDDDDPTFKTEQQPTNGADNGLEAITFEKPIRIPFTRAFNADTLTEDLYFQVFAERTTGSATLEIHDLILLPIDEGVVGYDDNNTGDTTGSTALRGGNVLDGDAGVIANRVVKYRVNSSDALVPSSVWAMMNRHIRFSNLSSATRLYFVQLHYPSSGTWGKEPLVASTGMGLAVEVYAHYRYAVLRGSA